MTGAHLLRISALLTAAVLLLLAVPAISAAALEPPSVPRIMISTEDGSGNMLVKDDGYVRAEITVYGTDGSVITDTGTIKVRGNSTAKALKKPYTFKFSRAQNLEGMGASKKWFLLADAFDPTFLRNSTVFALAEELGLAYTSRHCYSEVTLDGKPIGCYELYQPISVNPNSVDLDLAAGDFLLQYEKLREEEGVTYFNIANRTTMRFEIKEPEKHTEEQAAEIKEFMEQIVRAAKEKDFALLEELIDVPSFVRLYLLNEYAKNVDFGFSSVYFYRKAGRLYAGPVWDYDLSLGNQSDRVIHSYARYMQPTDIVEQNAQLYYYLLKVPEFAEAVRQTYCENWQLFYQLGTRGGYLDQQYEIYKDVFARNFKIWRIDKSYGFYMRTPDKTYEQNLQFLQSWCLAREAWLSEYFGAAEYGRPLTGDVDANGAVEMADAVLLTKIIAELTEEYPSDLDMRADLDYDRLISATDLRRLLLLLTPPTPPEEPEPSGETPPDQETGTGYEGSGSDAGSSE